MPLNGGVPNPSLIALLRADLESAGLSVETLSDLWGADAAAALRRGHRLPAQRATTTPSPRATLARLFVLGLPVERTGLEAALPALGVDGAVTLGLVGGDDLVHPLLDLRPYSFVDDHGVGAWWIASDLGENALGGALREDHVLGIGGASTTLSSLMIHRRVGLALDLGTGCGIQAMHASRHADRVIATDISARAIELARFNAELNAIANIEFRLGDLFAPVEGIRFDHIVSNPPFVITPRAEGVPAYE